MNIFKRGLKVYFLFFCLLIGFMAAVIPSAVSKMSPAGTVILLEQGDMGFVEGVAAWYVHTTAPGLSHEGCEDQCSRAYATVYTSTALLCLFSLAFLFGFLLIL